MTSDSAHDPGTDPNEKSFGLLDSNGPGINQAWVWQGHAGAGGRWLEAEYTLDSGTLKPIESPGADILIPKLTTTVHISCPRPDFMDPGGSELNSSLPQPENPCLIVEDSQPDSVGLEDDPESSYRALLARRLSSLQPAARSPVLELISSPPGSRCSQTDSHSESNSQAEPDIAAAADPRSPLQEESQVISICPPPSKNRYELTGPEPLLGFH
ncbi:hypothetical protein ATANTOWER_006447 [Ataeniobius toweri]|uniref:Uncharacterized protein n=1 Tax=Ataeniobius toweri TaxID=208326 RepID=A0ABU7BGN3_9TELE|nr:hypothetical protein [Ataeniobius toweri]